jgi:hypothetical protein
MIFADLLFAFLVALLLSVIFTLVFRRQGPWHSPLIFFVVVFMTAWAGGIWLAPIAFSWRLYWIPFLVFGLIVALLIAAIAPPRPARQPSIEARQGETPTKKKAVNALGETIAGLGFFLWTFLLALVVTIIIRYLWLHGGL